MEKPDKFESDDLPKILAALQSAKQAKAPSRLVIDIAENGGVLAVSLETKKRFK